ncbi:MAG: hypothetical protein ACOYI6_11175 [Christensenellales bacterium]|jgi:hypothetical protein
MKNAINVKVNWKHLSLEYQIRELDSSQDLSRTALLFRMIETGKDVEDWNKVKLLLQKVKKIEKAPVFTNFHARYDSMTLEKLEGIKEKILYDLKDDIKVLQQQYMLQLLMCNYLEKLKTEVLNVGEKINSEEIDAPEMVKILVEMILLDKDSSSINEIKDILVKWKNDN